MPKKTIRNSFYFYMMDYRKEQEANGRRFTNLKDVADSAGPSWTNLHPLERARYEKIAKDYKNTPGAVKKYTSLGESLDSVNRREQEANDADQRERRQIASMISEDRSLDSVLKKPFFLIDVNYYCETKELFVINEVSLLAFNIADGLISVYHKIVDPVFIPSGYASSAKDSFDEHQFPLPPLEMGEKDPLVILSEIREFLQNITQTESHVPPLFTVDASDKPSSQISAVNSFLNQICGHYEKVGLFSVYRLQILFHMLSQHLKNASNEGLPTEALALFQLQKDNFQYTAGLGCNYHEETDKYYNCTKARVKRWAFTMLDFLCPLTNVEMEAGCHLPDDTNVEAVAQVKERWEECRERERRSESSAAFTFVGPTDDHTPAFTGVARTVQPRPLVVPEPQDPSLDMKYFPSLGGKAPKAASSSGSTNSWNKAAAPSFPAPGNPWNKMASQAGSVQDENRQPLRKPGDTSAFNAEGVVGAGRGRGLGGMYN